MVTAVHSTGDHSGIRSAAYAQQNGFTYRFDWGLDGLRSLAPVVSVVVIVDVLRFTSAVSAAIESGSVVLPYPWSHTEAGAYAAERHALLAGRREDSGPSLSPTDLLSMSPGTRLVLPSPNGATLAFAARELATVRVLAGCLRNATATARHAHRISRGDPIAIIAGGERWGDPSGQIRPAFEDLVGAGAILAALDPSGAVAAPRCSPEASAARAAYQFARPRLFEHLSASASGRELLDRGWGDDVATASAHDVTDLAAELINDEFVPVR
ncbi:MAG: 2-phosphosulfolactate phosphatase [Ilumatobacteraceae bacterium]